MNWRNRLVGIERTIPDVRTFVTPVFSNRLHKHVIQEECNGRVVGVAVGGEFEPLASEIQVTVGEYVIVGFEASDRTLLVGFALALAPALSSYYARHVSASPGMTHTLEAIRRFLSAVACMGADGQTVPDSPTPMCSQPCEPSRIRALRRANQQWGRPHECQAACRHASSNVAVTRAGGAKASAVPVVVG